MSSTTGDALADVIAELQLRRADALTTLEHLERQRHQMEASPYTVENPKAILEYIEFFAGLVGRAAAECERIAGELPQGPVRAHADALRQMASNGAAEQRRCLMFRDKWINRPLPDERVRPLLNEISVTTRDQLTAFRDLNSAAMRLEALLKPDVPPSPDDKKGFDRRALFTRLFKP